MPGIADVQPKSIGSVAMPLVEPVVQPVAWTQALAPSGAQAFQESNAVVQAIKNRPVLEAQRQLGLQQTREYLSPEAIQSRQESVQLSGATAKKSLATLNSAEALAAFQKYRPIPIRGADGNYDYDAMAEVGANYLLAERQMTYAQAGLAVHPEKFIQNGRELTVFKNQFGETIGDNPDGTPNKYKAQYLDMRHAASKLFLKEPDWSSTTPGDIAKPDETGNTVTPRATAEGPPDPGINPGLPVDEPPSGINPGPPVDEPPSVVPLTLETPGANLSAMRKAAGLPVVGAGLFDPAAAVAAWQQQQAEPAVEPTSAPVTVTTPNHSITVAPTPKPVVAAPLAAAAAAAPAAPVVAPLAAAAAPAAPVVAPLAAAAAPAAPVVAPQGISPYVNTSQGPGLQTGFAPGFAPQDIVKTARSTDQFQRWSQAGDVIGEFRSLASAYTGGEKITAQKDVALANTLIRLQNRSGGGRGFSENRVANLEEATPVLERLYHLGGMALKQHAFTPETRQRLIVEGNRLVNAIETPARAQVNLAAQQLKDVGANPAGYFDANELGLLGGGGGASGMVGERRKLADGTIVRMMKQ